MIVAMSDQLTPNVFHTSGAVDARGLLSVRQAAAFLNLSASTLNKWRLSGDSPPYLKIGRRVLYDFNDLLTWAAQHRRHNTSEEV
jgi:predicted DNA-binding transcriptional regulator AlpA